MKGYPGDKVYLDGSILAVFPVIDPVGVTDIAARLGVKAKTVSEWRRRGDSLRGGAMPAPRWRVSGLDVWEWADVAEWHRCHVALVVAAGRYAR